MTSNIIKEWYDREKKVVSTTEFNNWTCTQLIVTMEDITPSLLRPFWDYRPDAELRFLNIMATACERFPGSFPLAGHEVQADALVMLQYRYREWGDTLYESVESHVRTSKMNP